MEKNKNMSSSKKIKVIFEQYAIPHYRVPFFEKLAEKVDLLVIASKNPKKIAGINDVRNPTGFKSIRLDSDINPEIYHPEIIEIIKKENPDVIISWGNSLRMMLRNKKCFSLIKEKDIKTAWMGCDGYDVHNFTIGFFLEFLPSRIKKAMQDFITTRRVNHFIAHSSHMLNFLKRVKMVSKNKITLVNNAIDTSKINSVYRRLLDENSPKNKYGIVFIGRLIPRKKIERLIEAFAHIYQRYPESILTIIGDGPFKNDLENMVQKINIENKVKFLGGIYDDSILAENLYRNSLFILPDVGGLSFNTAMAAGLPIIHTYADGTEEDLIKEGVNGWFFNGTTKDLIKKMDIAFSDIEKLKKMGEASERLITDIFNLENMVNGYVSVIEKILKNDKKN